MDERRACGDCGKKSPPELNSSLTGHGWRVKRVRAPDGTWEMQWRCPSCWRAHKEMQKRAPSAEAEPAGREEATNVFARAVRRLLGGR
jgi:hypothetical protein